MIQKKLSANNMSTYVMPAEWEKHEAIWLAWPYDHDTFPVDFEGVVSSYVKIIKYIHTSEKVNLLVLNQETKEAIIVRLKEEEIDINQIIFHVTEYADVWTRDYAPLFVRDMEKGTGAMIKWIYNAYGKKFPELLKDSEVFPMLKNSIDMPFIETGIVMEGGSLEVNGKGTLITTEQCLLNPNRNPDLTREKIEEYLVKYLGANHIIWLKEGIVNDHTDGHIDDVIKFVDAQTILCAYEDDESDPNFKILDANYKVLEESLDQDGNPFRLIKLPMPHINYDDGEKAPASYANFYIGNSVVLVPQFNDPNDEKALEIISVLFTDKRIVGIDCSAIVYGGGTIHCMTQQEPEYLK